jgi:hypothetical protein
MTYAIYSLSFLNKEIHAKHKSVSVYTEKRLRGSEHFTPAICITPAVQQTEHRTCRM